MKQYRAANAKPSQKRMRSQAAPLVVRERSHAWSDREILPKELLNEMDRMPEDAEGFNLRVDGFLQSAQGTRSLRRRAGGCNSGCCSSYTASYATDSKASRNRNTRPKPSRNERVQRTKLPNQVLNTSCAPRYALGMKIPPLTKPSLKVTAVFWRCHCFVTIPSV